MKNEIHNKQVNCQVLKKKILLENFAQGVSLSLGLFSEFANFK